MEERALGVLRVVVPRGELEKDGILQEVFDKGKNSEKGGGK